MMRYLGFAVLIALVTALFYGIAFAVYEGPKNVDYEDCRMMHTECRQDCRMEHFNYRGFVKKEKFGDCTRDCISMYWQCKKGVLGG
jgi:hypothetical protein